MMAGLPREAQFSRQGIMMDVQQKITELQEQLKQQEFIEPPDGWEEKYIINEDETPWWELEDRTERAKANARQRSRVWNKLRPGANTEYQRGSRARHPGRAVEIQREFRERHPGAAIGVVARYYKTPKGRATLAKMTAKRRKRSTDPALYAARVGLLHSLQESCANCGAPYDITHGIDHIIALCLGGTDDWDNLQPICILCHREKTQEDMRKFRAMVASNKEVL